MGRSGAFAAWRWSDSSIAEAKRAAQAAEQLASNFAAGRLSNSYGYGDRPMREPVLREMRDRLGAVTSAVTRNAYGHQALNSAVAL